MPIPAGRETRGNIIRQGLRKAGITNILVAARRQLNFILDDLWKDFDWPFLWTDVDLTLGSNTVSIDGVLPDGAEILKPREDDSLVITSFRGSTCYHTILERTPEDFRREAVPNDAVAGLPRRYSVDYARKLLNIWPIPEEQLTATFYCKQRPARVDPEDAVTYDANVPAFDDTKILIEEIYTWALEWDKDARAVEARMQTNAFIANRTGHLHIRHTQSGVVPLDNSRFKTPHREE